MYSSLVKLRSAILVFLTHHMALPLLKLIRKPERFPFTAEQLHAFPQGSLGRELIEMLERKKLKLLPYYARHDIKHILFDYDTTDEGEVCLQCFMLGNKHYSFPVLATVVYGFMTMPEHWKAFRAAFRRGKCCRPVSDCKWFEVLEKNKQAVRIQYSIL